MWGKFYSMKYDFLYVLGDSFAWNDDVKEEELFASLIADHYNLPLINKGAPGAGNNYIFRKAYKDCFNIDKGNPLVVLVYTSYIREETFANNQNQPLIINTCPKEFHKDFTKVYYADHYNEPYLLRESLVRIKAIQTLLDFKNIDRIECFSLGGKDQWSDDLHKTAKQVTISEFCMMDESLTSKAKDQSFTFINDVGTLSIGHPTVEGNRMLADWMIEKIENLYKDNL